MRALREYQQPIVLFKDAGRVARVLAEVEAMLAPAARGGGGGGSAGGAQADAAAPQ
jgi:hypothetical protein